MSKIDESRVSDCAGACERSECLLGEGASKLMMSMCKVLLHEWSDAIRWGEMVLQ